jgi:hypothetical protein
MLEIIEVIPGHRPRDAANIRPLLYNISIHATRSELIDATPASDDPNGHGGVDGNPNAGRRNRNGRGQGRRGGRKRRRTELAPEGRAVSMAMESVGWASSRPGRSDGVTVGSFWCSAIAAAAAPPAIPPPPVRVMDPWPFSNGSRRSRRYSKRRKRRSRKSRRKASTPAKASDPTDSTPVLDKADQVQDTTGELALDAHPASPVPGPTACSNSVLPPASRDACADLEPSSTSEVPDSQPAKPISTPVADLLLGQSERPIPSPGILLEASMNLAHTLGSKVAAAESIEEISDSSAVGTDDGISPATADMLNAAQSPVMLVQNPCCTLANGPLCNTHQASSCSRPAPSRFASPPVTMRRSVTRPRP